jgi:hypothetical protein
MEELLRNMPMVNQECNHVNQINTRFKEVYADISNSLEIIVRRNISKELGMVSIISFVYPPLSL